jgi:hypothetical protein
MFEEKLEAVKTAIEALGVALTDKGLFSTLSEVNGGLEAERVTQEDKGRRLRESYEKLQPITEAKQRVLARKADEDLSEGRSDDAQAKRAEIADLKANLDGILAQADEAEARVRELERQQKQNARELFERTFPEIRACTAALMIATVQLLEKVGSGLDRYAAENAYPGSPLVIMQLKSDLTCREHGPESQWFLRMLHWFGGRR